ncbi:MAG: aminotransferase class IV [Gammaproteobacteria bacterium]|nr:aminotransferase class IV [Gammaproteobacteria bacterium]
MPEALATALLDGELLPLADARISPLDRGFLYGDSVYEVIPCYDGKLFELPAHLERLQRSLDATRIERHDSPADWQAALESLVRANGGGNLAVYLQVSRGADQGRDHRFPIGVSPTVFGMCMPLLPVDPTLGLAAVTTEDLRWHRNDIKATSLLGNVLARQLAAERGADEAILLRDGLAIEASTSNLFVVSNGEVSTPPLAPTILGGITRQVILKLLDRLEIHWQETHISETDLRDADEIWLASSTRETRAVTLLDEEPVGSGRPGALWQRLFAAFQDYKAESLDTR